MYLLSLLLIACFSGGSAQIPNPREENPAEIDVISKGEKLMSSKFYLQQEPAEPFKDPTGPSIPEPPPNPLDPFPVNDPIPDPTPEPQPIPTPPEPIPEYPPDVVW